MMKKLSLRLRPEEAFDPNLFKSIALQEAGLADDAGATIRPLRRSIDARSRQQVWVNVELAVYHAEPVPPLLSWKEEGLREVSQQPPVIIVGAGPAGLFAAIRLIELGFKPIVLERGSDVRERRRDLAAINKEQTVNPESNYCFGEGGAGTYSDGKLYTRSKKRGDVRRVLELFVAHGATSDILVDAHPHIGTNKLPAVVQALRETIRKGGGEVYFNTRVDDFIIEKGELVGVQTAAGQTIRGLGVILATGHSARDIFHLLNRRGIAIESKPFALGVRVEHPQQIIDSIQYHCTSRSAWLPAAAYSLVAQVPYKGVERGVFSFCMCPGGFIVPAATAPGEIVVNGMSPSRRNSRYANSGIVVAIEAADLKAYAKWGPLAGLMYQQAVEQQACQAGGGTQVAPAQRLQDFVSCRASSSLPDTSYQPGLQSVMMDDVLPPAIGLRLREGFKMFGNKMYGYLTNEAQIVGVESRTSSPVKIPRNPDTLEHVQLARLYPCGEGAGFAGGIVSAAMDGERCAEKLVEKWAPRHVRL
ncbi:MAG: FAD-binding protein [Bacteroidetes bacterium]|nr:FAD-binding protein [Bacteroidota bacterium]